MLTVVPEHTRESNWLRTLVHRPFNGWLYAYIRAFRNAYFTAFPPKDCVMGAWLIAEQTDLSRPSPASPAGAVAMADGALLYEIDGEPCSDNSIA